MNVLDIAGIAPDDDSADNSTAINAAILAASAAASFSKQIAVRLPPRRFRIKNPIVLESNVWLYGPGAVVELDPAAAVRMVTTPGATTAPALPDQVTNIGIIGVTFDGNRHGGDRRPPDSNHALFLENVNGLTLKNVTVKYPLAFGAMIDTCTGVFVHNYRAASDQINQDGIHFFDSKVVTVDGLHGFAGDDLLGISAQYANTSDFTVSNVIGTSQGTGSIIRISQTDRSVTAGETRKLERMTFTNIVGYGSGNKGMQINNVHSSSTVQDIHVSNAVFMNTPRSGLDIVRVARSSFEMTLINCGTGEGISTDLTLHPVFVVFAEKTDIKARIVGVKDGFDGIHINVGTP